MTDTDKNELIQSLMRLRKRCCGGVSAACMTTNSRMAKDNAEFQKLIDGVKALIVERDEARLWLAAHEIDPDAFTAGWRLHDD